MRWTRGSVDSLGERIYFEVTTPDATVETRGTVVLGHGAGGSHAAWFQQVPAFAAAGWRVVTWDTPGFGLSTLRTGELTCEAAVAHLGAVLDATATPSAYVVGQSMGGWWAAAFAVARPDRTTGLVLANTVGGVWSDDLLAHFATLGAPAPDPDDDGEPLGRHSAIGPQLPERDLPLAFLYQQLNTFHEPPMGAVVRALTGTRHDPAALAALPWPLLWISSTHDDLFPAALIEPVARAAGARFEVIAEAGHSPYFERAPEWNARVLAFLDAPADIPR